MSLLDTLKKSLFSSPGSYQSFDMTQSSSPSRGRALWGSYPPITKAMNERAVYPNFTLDEIRQNARRLYTYNSHAKNIIENLTRFTLGDGVRLVLSAEMSDEVRQEIYKRWEGFSERIGWIQRQKEIVRRCVRDGECFLFFPGLDAEDFQNYVDPELVKSQDPKISYGIETSPTNVNDVYTYRVENPMNKLQEFIVPAPMMQHIKVNVDSNVKRGLSELLTVLKDLENLPQFRDYRITQNKARSAVVMVRKIRGGLAAMNQQAERERAEGSPSNQMAAVKPGSMITIDPESDIEYKSPNLGSGEAEIDYRMLLLSVAAGVSFPEFVLSSDAKNNNLASIKQSTLTLIKRVEDLQSFFDLEFRLFFNRWLAVQPDIEIPRDMVSLGHFQFPVFDIRDQMTDVQVLSVLYDKQLVSGHDFCARFGYNWDEQVRKIADEKKMLQELGLYEDKPESPQTVSGTGAREVPSDGSEGRGDKGDGEE